MRWLTPAAWVRVVIPATVRHLSSRCPGCMRSSRLRLAMTPCGAMVMVIASCGMFSRSIYGQQPNPTPAPGGPEYVGSETCQACHEDIFTAFAKNPHHAVETQKKFG